MFKFSLHTDELKKALGALKALIDKNPVLPEFECVLFEKNDEGFFVSGTNSEQTVKIRLFADCIEMGTVLIGYEILAKTVENLPSCHVTFETKADKPTSEETDKQKDFLELWKKANKEWHDHQELAHRSWLSDKQIQALKESAFIAGTEQEQAEHLKNCIEQEIIRINTEAKEWMKANDKAYGKMRKKYLDMESEVCYGCVRITSPYGYYFISCEAFEGNQLFQINPLQEYEEIHVNVSEFFKELKDMIPFCSNDTLQDLYQNILVQADEKIVFRAATGYIALTKKTDISTNNNIKFLVHSKAAKIGSSIFSENEKGTICVGKEVVLIYTHDITYKFPFKNDVTKYPNFDILECKKISASLVLDGKKMYESLRRVQAFSCKADKQVRYYTKNSKLVFHAINYDWESESIETIDVKSMDGDVIISSLNADYLAKILLCPVFKGKNIKMDWSTQRSIVLFSNADGQKVIIAAGYIDKILEQDKAYYEKKAMKKAKVKSSEELERKGEIEEVTADAVDIYDL